LATTYRIRENVVSSMGWDHVGSIFHGSAVAQASITCVAARQGRIIEHGVAYIETRLWRVDWRYGRVWQISITQPSLSIGRPTRSRGKARRAPRLVSGGAVLQGCIIGRIAAYNQVKAVTHVSSFGPCTMCRCTLGVAVSSMAKDNHRRNVTTNCYACGISNLTSHALILCCKTKSFSDIALICVPLRTSISGEAAQASDVPVVCPIQIRYVAVCSMCFYCLLCGPSRQYSLAPSKAREDCISRDTGFLCLHGVHRLLGAAARYTERFVGTIARQ
jgi:hypothetical protein